MVEERGPVRKGGAARLFWVGMGLLGLFLFPASRAELAEDTTSVYRAPDGSLLKRSFFSKEGPRVHNTLILCSDKQEFYLPRLRRFSEYVFSDRKGVIVDGRSIDSKQLPSKGITMIYLGFASEQAAETNKCLQRFPSFYSFVDGKLEADHTQLEFIRRKTMPQLLAKAIQAVCVNTVGLDNKDSAVVKSVGLYYQPDKLCLKEFFLFLYNLEEIYCYQDTECKSLWNYVETGLLEMKEK